VTNKKDLIIAVLATFCLTATLFMVASTRSQTPSGTYDPLHDANHDGKIDVLDAIIVANDFGTSGDPTLNVNVTNWPSRLLANYADDSGWFTLGAYPNPDSSTYRTLSITGYRQVSVYVIFDSSSDVVAEVRVGMGDFNGCNIAAYNWATYYSISEVTGADHTVRPFTQTIDVRGPQLRIEAYNNKDYSISVRIAVYVTC
jgi:hypothetical protein